MASVALATEDELSEVVGERLLGEVALTPDLLFRRGGNGYLRTNIQKWSRLAGLMPVLVLTDLDNAPCASALIGAWLRSHSQPQNLVVRVAVREVEAWLLADHEGMRGILGARSRFPPDPDAIADPKRVLLQLARRAPREVREDLVAARGSAAAQGIGYNG